jgi:hypothetical protein
MCYVCVCREAYTYIYMYNIILDRLKMLNYIELPIMKFPEEVTNVNT